MADLTADDYLTSSYPYGDKCLTFNNFFFNVANWDNGQNWSTPWVIDDPKIFVDPPAGKTVAQLNRKKRTAGAPPAFVRVTKEPADAKKHKGFFSLFR